MNLGVYYMFFYLVDCVYKFLKKYVGIENYMFLDIVCGDKEFLKFYYFKKIGVDIDFKCDVLIINVLVNFKRENYGIS